jgi:signal transduction histidine kinase
MNRDPRANERVHETLARLADLDRSYRAALTTGDQRSAFRRSVELLVGESEFNLAWIGLPEEDGLLKIRVTGGARTDLLRDLAITPGSGLTGKVFTHGGVDWVDEYFAARSITHDFDLHIGAEGVVRLIAVPVVCDGKIVGVLSAGSRSPGSFGTRAIEHIVTTANGAALAGTVAERARHAAEIAAHDERRRVAMELHDTVGAMLYAIGAGVRGLSGDSAQNADLSRRLAKIEEQATEASRLLRESLRALNASPAELALSVALQADCRCFEERSGITTHLMTLGDLPSLAPGRQRLILGAVREALLNVEKHAKATSVAVTISAYDGELIVAVTDDGVGVGNLEEPDATGLGLPSVADALAQIGGRLEIRSPGDGGTVWRARLPL